MPSSQLFWWIVTTLSASASFVIGYIAAVRLESRNHAELAERAERARAEAERLSTELKRVEQELEAAKGERQRVQAERDAANEARDHAKTVLLEVKKGSDQGAVEREALNLELARLRGDLDQANKLTTTLSADLARASQEVRDAQAARAAAEASLAAATDQTNAETLVAPGLPRLSAPPARRGSAFDRSGPSIFDRPAVDRLRKSLPPSAPAETRLRIESERGSGERRPPISVVEARVEEPAHPQKKEPSKPGAERPKSSPRSKPDPASAKKIVEALYADKSLNDSAREAFVTILAKFLSAGEDEVRSMGKEVAGEVESFVDLVNAEPAFGRGQKETLLMLHGRLTKKTAAGVTAVLAKRALAERR